MKDKIKDLSMADLLALLQYFENKMKIETERKYYYYNMNSWKKFIKNLHKEELYYLVYVIK